MELSSVLSQGLEIWCVKGMYRLKVVSSEKNLGFNYTWSLGMSLQCLQSMYSSGLLIGGNSAM